MRLVILAAGQGTRLRPLTDGSPKCMVELHGRPLLEWQVRAARAAGCPDVVVVRGYAGERITLPGLTFVENPAFASTNMVESLRCARAYFGTGFVMAYGDIVYEPGVLAAVRDAPDELAVAVDEDWLTYWRQRFDDPLSDAETMRRGADGRILELGQRPRSLAEIDGQYIGLVKWGAGGVRAFEATYGRAAAEARDGRRPLRGQREFAKLYMTDLIQGVIDGGVPVRGVPIRGGWLEIDSLRDLEVAHGLSSPGPDGTLRIRRDGRA